MKMMFEILISSVFLLATAHGDLAAELEVAVEEKLTSNQDELSADIQELVELQTQSEVIDKLEEVEVSMIQATLKLLDGITDQETLAIQTDIIEKAYEAAEKKSESQGEGQSETSQAMMDMLKKMLGKQDSSSSQNSKAGSQGAGERGDGELGKAPNTSEQQGSLSGGGRVVPTSSAYSGQLLPDEFSELLEPYNDSSQ